MQPLKLVAMDKEDLDILSAHLQDAVGLVGDMAYLRGQKRFAAILNRFVWEQALKPNAKSDRHEFERRRTALRFERVLSAQVQNIRQTASSAVLELLAIRFEPGEAPSGTVSLIFAGGGIIRLNVECIEAELADLGAAWETSSLPKHPESGVSPGGPDDA